MPEDALDVKQPDEIEESSDSTETSKQDANAGKSMEDFVKESMVKDPTSDKPSETTEADPVKSAEAKESISTVEKDSEDAEKVQAEKPEGETEDTEGEGDEDEQDKAVPYERFREVNDKANQAQEALKSAEADVQHYHNITGFCERNNISPQQFNETMELLAALNSGDYEKVAPRVRELYEQVQGLSGEKLPPDIQARVDAGLDLEVAQQWAKDRAKAGLVESRSKKSVEQLQREQLQDYERQTNSAVEQWVTTKTTADPDFKKGSIKWEEVQDRYSALLNAKDDKGQFTNPTRTAQDVVALLERCYRDVGERIKKRNNGKPLTRKILPTNHSSTRSTSTRFENAKTMEEAISIGMKERGHTIN